MAPHSSTLAWKIPWTEEPGRLQSMGSPRLSDFTFTFHLHALEKEMATHSSVLAWRIPGTGEPVGLPSMGSHTVGHDWSDLAANWAKIFPVSFKWTSQGIKLKKVSRVTNTSKEFYITGFSKNGISEYQKRRTLIHLDSPKGWTGTGGLCWY